MAGSLHTRSALHQHSLRFGPNMTPMVDIVMVILIFFMAATSFVGEELLFGSVLEQDVPAEARAADPMELPPVRIEIRLYTRDGQIRADAVGETGVTLDAVLRAVETFVTGARSQDLVVVIRPEAGVPYGAVVRVHEACHALGLERVGMSLGADR